MAQTVLSEDKNSKKSKNVALWEVARGKEIALITPLDNPPPHPVRLHAESDEERAKRLARRKALTLKAFQATYQQQKKCHVAK